MTTPSAANARPASVHLTATAIEEWDANAFLARYGKETVSASDFLDALREEFGNWFGESVMARDYLASMKDLAAAVNSDAGLNMGQRYLVTHHLHSEISDGASNVKFGNGSSAQAGALALAAVINSFRG